MTDFFNSKMNGLEEVDLTSSLNAGNHIDLLLLDFSKAFNTNAYNINFLFLA